MLLNKVFWMFDARDRLYLIYLISLSFIAAVLEIFCIGLLIPLGSLVASRDSSDVFFKMLGLSISCSASEYLTILFLTFLLKNIYMYYFTYVQSKFTYLQQEKISSKIFENIIDQPFIKLDSLSPADVARGITHDVTQYVQTVIQPIISLFADFLVGISLIGYLIFASDVENLGAVSLVVVALSSLAYFMFRWNKKFLRDSGAQRQKFEGERIGLIYGAFGSIKEMIVYRETGYFITKIKYINSEISKIMYKMSMIQSSPKLILEQFLVLGIIIIVLKKISIGYITAFIAAAFRFSVILNRSLQNIQHLRHANKSIEYVCESLNIPARTRGEAGGREEKIDQFKSLVFRSVDFGFEDKLIYKNLDVEINQYDFVAIVGESGSGKSTFLSMLMGLINPQSGGIFINDLPMDRVTKSWHDLISYVPQDVFIMDDSIFANITYGSSCKDIYEYKQAALKKLEMAEINIEQLVSSIDDKVQSSSISGGQRQRIALARALYRDGQVLILDEFTSALDPKTIEKILENLSSFKGKKTVIMVTHNSEILKICNKIINIDKIRFLQKDQ